MELCKFFKSIVDQDTSQVVVCDLNHTVIYMNPAAEKRYAKSGGAALCGKSIFDCHNARSSDTIKKVVAWFAADKSHNRIYSFYNEQLNKDVYMIALRDDEGTLIGYYEKHEFRNRETAKLYDFAD